MKISAIALGVTLGVLWAASFCGIGVLHAVFPGYGAEFFQLMGSIYPGIAGDGSLSDVVIGALYGLVDGFFFGCLMAWLYNFVFKKLPTE